MSSLIRSLQGFRKIYCEHSRLLNASQLISFAYGKVVYRLQLKGETAYNEALICQSLHLFMFFTFVLASHGIN